MCDKILLLENLCKLPTINRLTKVKFIYNIPQGYDPDSGQPLVITIGHLSNGEDITNYKINTLSNKEAELLFDYYYVDTETTYNMTLLEGSLSYELVSRYITVEEDGTIVIIMIQVI